MKRLIQTIVFSIIALAAFAAPPNLACEELFSRKRIEAMKDEDVNVLITKNKESYYRCIKSNKNKELVGKIKELMNLDEPKSFNSSFKKDGKNYAQTLYIYGNNTAQIIQIGFFWTEEGSINFFIQGPPQAFN